MAKQYGEKSLFEKVFGGKLFPKGTGGILPKYDKALDKSKSEVSKKSSGFLFESPKNKNIRLSTESGKANRKASDMMKAAEKKFDMEKSNMAKKFMQGAIKDAEASAKRDTAKTKLGKGKNLRDKRKVKLAPKGTFPKKKEPKLDADTVKSYKKRIKYMEGRKAKGKNYSKANLSRLKAELAAN